MINKIENVIYSNSEIYYLMKRPNSDSLFSESREHFMKYGFTEDSVKSYMKHLNKKMRQENNTDKLYDNLKALIESDKTDAGTVSEITKLVKCFKCNDFMDSSLKVCREGHAICTYCYNNLFQAKKTEYRIECPQCKRTYQNHFTNHEELDELGKLFYKIYDKYDIKVQCSLDSCKQLVDFKDYSVHKKNHRSCTECVFASCDYVHDINLQTNIDHYVYTHDYYVSYIAYPTRRIHLGFANNVNSLDISTKFEFDCAKHVLSMEDENFIILIDTKKCYQDVNYAKSLNLVKYEIDLEIVPINESQEVKTHIWSLEGSGKKFTTDYDNRKVHFEFAFDEHGRQQYGKAEIYREINLQKTVRIIIESLQEYDTFEELKKLRNK